MGPRQSVADAQTANTQRGSEIGVRPTTPADTSTEYPLSLLPRSRPRPSTIADHGFDDALTSISADPADELKRVTVSRNDCLYAGPRPRYLVGPLDNLDDSRQLRDRLRVIASGGPSNRVGLLPDPMSRSWQFDSTARSAAVSITEAATLDIRDPARAIADFAIEPKNRAPLHIHLARPWVLLDFDHGLGGGKLMSELIAAMTSDALGFSEPLPPTVCRRPGLRALAHTTRVTPGRLVQAVCDLPSLSKQPVCGEPQPLYQQPDLVYVGSDPEFLRRVRARRDRDFPDVSVLALITSATLRALTSFGIETHPSVLVVIDLGRHLPVGVGTLSNFLGFAPVSVASPISAQAISDQIEAYTNGCRSLVRYQLRALTRLRHPIRKSVIRRSDDRRARLVVTDHGESLGSRKIRWAGPEEGRIFVRYAAPLESSNEITLATNRIGDQLHLTATFYSTQFDRESVRAALLRVVNGIDGSDVDRKLATAP